MLYNYCNARCTKHKILNFLVFEVRLRLPQVYFIPYSSNTLVIRRFRLDDKSRKTFAIIVLKICVYLNVDLEGLLVCSAPLERAWQGYPTGLHFYKYLEYR